MRLFCFILGAHFFTVHGQYINQSQGGAEFRFDGIDDVAVIFPSFSLNGDWTVEAWVKVQNSTASDGNCLINVFSYSGESLLALETRNGEWLLRYSTVVLGTSNAVGSTPALQHGFAQHHIALTHDFTSGIDANITIFINGSEAVSATVPIMDSSPSVVVLGACYALADDGWVREKHFAGHLEELRHWSVARSASEIQLTINSTQPATRWLTPFSRVGLQAQYNFDITSDFEVVDSSGNNNHGMRGSGNAANEMPRYEKSIFTDIYSGAWYFELRQQANASCPLNCLDMNQIFNSNLSIAYTGLLIMAVPTNSQRGIYLTVPGNSTRLLRNELIQGTQLVLHTENPVTHDSFEVKFCRGQHGQLPSSANCTTQPANQVVFRLLPSTPPIAGEVTGLELFGTGSYIQLQEPVGESATIEFWGQMKTLEGSQSLFSSTHAGTGQLLLALGMLEGHFHFHFCSAQLPFGGVQPVTLKLPQLDSLDRQHISVSWKYITSIRGRAAYNVSLYLNCLPILSLPLEVKDACAHFGRDSEIQPLSFGQQFKVTTQGLISDNFASMHIDDIRIWRRQLQTSEICDRMRTPLSGDEPGLQGYYPITAADQTRGDSLLRNHAGGGGRPARLSCSPIRSPCFDAQGSQGFLLRPSVFMLPSEPLTYITSAGVVAGQMLLPPLRLPMPAFDPDNFATSNTQSSNLDDVYIKVSMLPALNCGTLIWQPGGGQTQNVTLNISISSQDLPIFFEPARSNDSTINETACQTVMLYGATDSQNLSSPFNATVNITVKPQGPRIERVDIFDTYSSNTSNTSNNGVSIGDIIAITFDRPTSTPIDARIFDVLNGSLGRTNFNVTWNDAGNVVMLEITGHYQDLVIEPGITRFLCNARSSTQLQSIGGDSYPCVDTSPVVQGSFNTSNCSAGDQFNKSEARCVPCDPGTYLSRDGSCQPCSPGSFAAQASSQACQLCAPGSFLPVTSVSKHNCSRAAPGRYVADFGATFEMECPEGMFAEQSGQSACLACPPCADCQVIGYELQFAIPTATHYRVFSGAIMKCKIPPACQGWSVPSWSNRCKDGMQGHLCLTCEHGWWRPINRPQSLCQRCGAALWVWALLISCLQLALTWFLALLCIDAALWGSMHIIVWRLLLNYSAAVGTMAQLDSWELEQVLGQDLANIAATVLNYAFRLDGGVPLHIMSLECLRKSKDDNNPWTYLQTRTLVWCTAMPMWLLGIASISLIAFELYTLYCRMHHAVTHRDPKAAACDSSKKAGDDCSISHSGPRFVGLFRKAAVHCRWRHRTALVLQDCLPMAIVGYFLLTPAMLRELGAMLKCERLVGSQDELRLLAAPEVLCWQGTHLTMGVITICFLLLWSILVPAVAMLFLWKHRDDLTSNTQLKICWTFLSDGYEKQYIYWEGIIHLRRVLVILISCWPPLSRMVQLTFYQIIGACAFLAHLAFKPFDNRGGELLDRIELYGICLFVLMVTVVQIILLMGTSPHRELIPVLFNGTMITLSFLLFSHGSDTVMRFGGFGVIVCLCALMLLCWISTPGSSGWKSTAFLFVMVAVVLNGLYSIWMSVHVLLQWQDLCSSCGSRKRFGAIFSSSGAKREKKT